MDLIKETGHFRQLLAAISAALCVAATGSCLGWVTPILNTLTGDNSPVKMDASQGAWMVALLEFGNLLTPIPAGFLTDTYGRKPLILSTGPLYIVSWIIILNGTTVTTLCIARVIQGLAMGIVFTVVPMYLGEIPSPMFRGTVTSIFQSALYFGYLYEYCIGPFVSYKIFTALSVVPPVVFTLWFLYQPETPYFLVMQGNMEKASKSLMYLRGKSRKEDVQVELDAINRDVTREMANQSNWRDVIATSADRNALLIVNVVGAVKIMSGSIAVPTYSTQLFAYSEFSLIAPDYLTIIMGVIIFTSSFFSTALTDITGRRPLLLVSTVGCGLCLLTVSGYFFALKNFEDYGVKSYNWVCPVAIILFCLFLAFGLDPVSITYRSEMFPSNTRAIAASINTMNFTAGSFISLKGYQVVADNLGVDVLYCIFAVICLSGALWMYFIAIETKGKTLQDIQQELKEIAEARRKTKEILNMDEGSYKTLYI